MDSFKVFVMLALVAAANCYVITKDNQHLEDRNTFLDTFNEVDGEVQSYRPRRDAHYDPENLFENVENVDTIDDAHEASFDELYRPKRNPDELPLAGGHLGHPGRKFFSDIQTNMNTLDAYVSHNRGAGRPNTQVGVQFTRRF